MGYMGDFGKIAKGAIKSVPNKIDGVSITAGIKAGLKAEGYGVSKNTAEFLTEASYRGTKYGLYGAAGAATVGAAVGLVSQDTTVMGGALNGAGLGAVGGAGAGAVAAAIARSIR